MPTAGNIWYPELTDAANVPADMQLMAENIRDNYVQNNSPSIQGTAYIQQISAQTLSVASQANILALQSVNINGGSAQSIVYQTAANTTNFISAPVSSNTFLKWNGTSFEWASAGVGTVTSITADSPLTGGTITGSGSIGLNQSALTIATSQVTGLDTALSEKAPLVSPTFTGTVTVPTPSASTAAATKGYVDASTINSQTVTSYTLVLSDSGKLVEMNVTTTANTITIPPNSSVAFPTGTVINIVQIGTGQTSIAPGSGVTLKSTGSKRKLYGQYSGAVLVKRGTDDWLLIGDLTT